MNYTDEEEVLLTALLSFAVAALFNYRVTGDPGEVAMDKLDHALEAVQRMRLEKLGVDPFDVYDQTDQP